eukprot:EG_transcript_16604
MMKAAAWNEPGHTMEEFLGHWMGLCHARPPPPRGGERRLSGKGTSKPGSPGKVVHGGRTDSPPATRSTIQPPERRKKPSSRIVPGPPPPSSPQSPASREPAVGFRGLQQLTFAHVGPRIDSQRRASCVLDLSFCNVREVEDCLRLVPRSGIEIRKAVDATPAALAPADAAEEPTEPPPSFYADVPSKPTRSVTYRADCVRLNNNLLASVARLPEVLGALVPAAGRRLTALDLSFNAIAALPDAWGGLPLQVLHLHANSIAGLSEVLKLRPLRGTLLHLTLHGNPVLQDPAYRPTLLALLPRLRSLDFSPVTPTDREDAALYARLQPPPPRSGRRTL